MNTITKRFSQFMLCLMLLLVGTAAVGQISQKPLLTGVSSVKPNVMAIVDNSGSMLFQYAPANYRNSFEPTIPFVSVTQSSDANKIFYNPRVFYEPRRNSDNSLQPQATEATAATITTAACPNSIKYPEDLEQQQRGCDPTTYGVKFQTTSFVTQPQGWASTCNAAGTNCEVNWIRYQPYQTVVFPTLTWVFMAKEPSVLVSTTLTHYLCTAYNASNKCTTVQRYLVPNSDPGYTYPNYPGRSDCAGTCTWAIERQNVLNWNLYHNDRLKAVASSFGAAFANPSNDGKFRLGYGHLNTATTSFSGTDDKTTRIRRGVRLFSDDASLPAPYKTDKTNFFNWLYTLGAGGGTPLNGAMFDVGEYYKNTTNTGPWAADPVRGSSTSTHLECRKSNFIFFSDGEYNDSEKKVGNVDSTGTLVSGSSTAHVHPDTKSTFTYNITPSKTATFIAYPDTDSNSFADLAMTYWLQDLRPDLPNRVSTRAGRPAFWQHLVTYTIGFGVSTTRVNQASISSYQTAFLNGNTFNLDWGTSDKIADFMHGAYNTTGQFFNVSNGAEVQKSIETILSDIDNQSGRDGGVAVADTNGALDTLAGELKYVPRYNTLDSSGDIDAFTLDAFGNVVGTTPLWIASRQVPSPAARKLFTMSGINIPTNITTSFSALPADVKTALGAGADDSLMSYLRGTLAVVKPTGGLYRLRSSLLGAMVNNAPTYVRGELNMGYANSTVTGSSSYAAYKANKLNNRSGILMATANDGTLHAIDALKGNELMGFMPRSAMPKLQTFATEPYTFQYVLDGPTIEGDVYGTAAGVTGWHNIVTGTGGRGGKFVYAIEAPVPTSASGSGSAATPTLNNMLWELNNDNANMTNLGHVLNAPISGQMADGTWVTIFGNGLYSTGNQASLFIVNALTGAFIKEISTNTGSAGSPNGLNGVTLMRDANRIVVAALAGDKLGNLWKFDLKSATQGDWKVAFSGKPLFKDPAGKSISGAPAWQPHPVSGYIAIAATGTLVEESDRTDLSQKTIYGIWDKTAIGGTETATFVATLPLPGTQTLLVQTSSTATNTVTGAFTYYTVSANAINWDIHSGWKLEMNFEPGQRSVFDVNNLGASVVVASVVPVSAISTVESCSSSGNAKDYLYIIDALSGGAAKSFDVTGDGIPDAYSILSASTGFGRGSVIAKDYVGYRTEFSLAPTSSIPTCVSGFIQVTIIGTEANSVRAFYSCANNIGWRRSWRQLFNPPKMQ